MGALKLEPAMVRGAVTTVIALAAIFGLQLTDSQTEAVVGAVLALLPLVQAFATRQVVTPVVKVDEAVDSAIVEAETAAADMDAEGDPLEVDPRF